MKALIHGVEIQIDEKDAPILSAYKWHVYLHGKIQYISAGHVLPDGKRVTLYLHRVIMGPPAGMQVDHINHDPFDNRRCNLRICTPRQQSRNTRTKREGKPFKGIRLRRSGRWAAHICENRKFYQLGTFDSPEEAARAYDKAARERFGAFASLNFPS